MKLLSLGLIAAAALLSVSLEAAPLQSSVLSATDPIKEMTSPGAVNTFFQGYPGPDYCADCIAQAQVNGALFCWVAWLYGGEAAYNECVQSVMEQCIPVCFPGFSDGIKRQPFKSNPLVQYAPADIEVPLLR